MCLFPYFYYLLFIYNWIQLKYQNEILIDIITPFYIIILSPVEEEYIYTEHPAYKDSSTRNYHSMGITLPIELTTLKVFDNATWRSWIS